MLDKKWYNEEDLNVFYYFNDNPKDIKTKNYLDKTFSEGVAYKILFLISGDRIFEIGNERITVSDGAVAIAEPNKRIGFERISNKKNCYLEIKIHPKVFKNIQGDNDFLRIFHKTDDKNKVFYPSNFDNDTCSNLLNSIITGLDKHLGRIHLLSKIFSIISEFDIYFDKNNSNEFRGSDNYNVNLMGYIEKHFTEKLTLDDLCKRFYISKTTLNSIVKQNTGVTCLKYINYLRISEAKRMIIHSFLPLKKISETSGFSDYSTFYREYKNCFGITPSEEPRVK